MAVWFGHTQTLTSISKSVSTVASGILGLEDHLATFMKKVIYYDRFFQRVRANLPKEVARTAERLLARCYEYRDEIRDELESSLAYVADAGRWVVGMEDWNSKMEKRVHQISELVLLANSLLVEYAMTGKIGGEGSKDELDAYLRTIAASVVLKNQTKKTAPPSSTSSPASGSPSALLAKNKKQLVAGSSASNGSSTDSRGSGSSTPGASEPYSSASAEAVSSSSLLTPLPIAVGVESHGRDQHQQQTVVATSGGVEEAKSASDDSNDADDDYDAFNPFADDYQSPADKLSLASSLASLANESTHSSVPDIATYDVDADHSHPRSHDGDRYPAEPDSPVDLHEYECLDMDSIPKYDAFKPSLRSRGRRLTVSLPSAADAARLSKSVGSVAAVSSANAIPVEASGDESGSGQQSITATRSSFPSLRVNTSESSADAQRQLFLDDERARSRAVPPSTTRPSRSLMDMNYSYDFQREQENNPFVSPPPPAFLQRQVDSRGIESLSPLDLGSTPQIREDDGIEDADEGDGVREVNSESHERAPRLSEEDETDALIAAIAAASEDDFDLFGARNPR